MTLLDLLIASAYDHLFALTQSLALPVRRRLPRRDLLQHLQHFFAQSTALPRLLDALSLAEREALHTLCQTDDPPSLHAFTHRFGPLRPYCPRRPDSPRHPWRHPASPAESLYYKALIFCLNDQVFLPDEVRTALVAMRDKETRRQGNKEMTSLSPPLPVSQSPCLQTDLCLFLALLAREDIRPLHDRWLAMRYLYDLNRRLTAPEELANVRSERAIPRLAFIHYLAEAAGLVGLISGYLKPTPAAAHWLTQPCASRALTLWQTWLDPAAANLARWQRYRLPAHATPRPLAVTSALIAELRRQPSAAPFPLQPVLDRAAGAIVDLIPWWLLDQTCLPPDSFPLQGILRELIAGPLTWLGLVSEIPNPEVRLTPLGAWLLERGPQPPEPSPSAFHLAADFTINPTRDDLPLPLPHLFSLEQWTEWTAPSQYRLTPASVARAIARGAVLADLFALLVQTTGTDLTPAQRTTLTHWATAATPLTLRHLLVLEGDPQQLHTVYTSRTLRRHLGVTLSPGRLVVQSPDVLAFTKTLQRLGHHLRVQSEFPSAADQTTPAASPPDFPAPPLPRSSAPLLSPSDAAWLWLSAEVSARLARHLGLTPAPAAALRDRIAAQAEPAALDAARALAGQLIARFERALDGETPIPPAAAGLDQRLARLEAAIDQGTEVELLYWTPSRAEPTPRRVRPLRLEWRATQPYLIAFDHLRQDERTFRLDRILEVT